MSKPRIHFLLTEDVDAPCGGVKQIYRQVDVLNGLGYDANVVQVAKDFRMTWFKHKTKIISHDELVLKMDDVLVVSEMEDMMPQIEGADKCRIVVFAQNPYGVFLGHGGSDTFIDFYKKKVSALMCVSEHSKHHISSLFPFLDVHRIRYSFDRYPFEYSSKKEKVITYMTRRMKKETEEVIYLLRVTGNLEGWSVVAIERFFEWNVAQTMMRSSVFLAGSSKEGFGMPPAEAMSCGCAVVGWHGAGGEEFFRPDVCLHANEGDALDCVEKMKTVLAMSDEKRLEMGKRASDFIRSEYSSEKEIKSVSEAWKGIIDRRVTITAGVEVKAKDKKMFDVAAFVSTLDEGPYLEAILRWLSPRVGRVYVVESHSSFFQNQVSQGKTKEIVDRVSDDFGNIVYKELEGQQHPAPDIKEAHERNQALQMIQNDGYKWIWIVDADEFYEDKQADDLWAWFREEVGKNPDVMGARSSWYTYWRSLSWRIDPPESFHPNIIIRSDCRIASSRHLYPDQERRIADVPESVCMVRHYSWAKTPEDTKHKIDTWTHGHQVIPGWFYNVFMKWTPGSDMQDVHPTEPSAYKRIVRCELPLPQALEGHLYSKREVISFPKRIKAVILNHNKPENADKLFEQLSSAFDDVEILDSGSDSDKIPINVTRARGNIYWTGAWNEVMRTCRDYDAVWVVGCDIVLESNPIEYRESIEKSLPFGIWSPAVEGRAQQFMQRWNFNGQKLMVRNVEGISFAASRQLMERVDTLVGSPIGYGQDFWMCKVARDAGLPNYIDGSVAIQHPDGRGYDDGEAVRQMEETFGGKFGPDFRRTVFEYKEQFKENIMSNDKKFTIVTVDNGWGYAAFRRIVKNFTNVRLIVMQKGAASAPVADGIEVVPYDASMSTFLAEADAALFPVVGEATKPDMMKLMMGAIPTIVHVNFGKDIEHEKSGFVFQDEDWASHWLREIRSNPEITKRIREYWKNKNAQVKDVPVEDTKSPDSLPLVSSTAVPIVTVITPTYKRDTPVIKRSIDCMKLQTFAYWEQLICSNGEEEPQVRKLIESLGDTRVRYACVGKEQKTNDYGNTARAEMLKAAQGKYVLFLDDDNMILPDYLQEMVIRLENSPDAAFAVCDIMHFGPLRESEVGAPPLVLKGEPVKLYHIDPLQVLVRADVMKKLGWNTEVGYLSDGITLERLGRENKHIKVNKVLGIHM